jgi:predicted MFS family arabinose efflux permease
MNNYFVLFLVGFAGFISAADNWIASLLLPNIASTFNVTVSAASIVMTAYLVPYGFMQPIYGFYSDRYGKSKVLQLLMLCLSVSTFLCSSAGSLLWLTIFRFSTGFFAAGIIAVSLGILGEFFQKEFLTKIVGLFLGIVFLGQGFSSGIGGWLIENMGWQEIFIIFSGLSFLSFLLIFLMPSIPSAENYNQLFRSIALLLSNRDLSVIYVLAFCNGFAVLGGYSFIGSYLFHALHVSYTYAGIGLMLFGFICFISGFANKMLLTKLSKTFVLNMGFLFSLCSLILLSTHQLYLSYVAILMLGMGYVWVQSILASQALDIAANHKGLSSGLIGVGIFGGGGIGTFLGGELLKGFDYPTLFLSLAGFIVVPLMIYNTHSRWLVRCHKI